MKKCAKCGISKEYTEFHKASKERDGHKSRCKTCTRKDGIKYRSDHADARKRTTLNYHKNNAEKINEKSRRWYKENRERAKITRAKWRIKNSQKDKDDVAKYQSKNKEKLAAAAKEWNKKNPHLVQAKGARRRARQAASIPKWADHCAINGIYKKAKKLNYETKESWQVDHIVPIHSKIVCGLHCEHNLQIITKKENLKKSNSTWPDMP